MTKAVVEPSLEELIDDLVRKSEAAQQAIAFGSVEQRRAAPREYFAARASVLTRLLQMQTAADSIKGLDESLQKSEAVPTGSDFELVRECVEVNFSNIVRPMKRGA